MFCKKCGMKCDSSRETCVNCGYPIAGDEYCGGFWGLVGEKPPVAAMRKTSEAVGADIITGSAQNVKKQKRNPGILIVGIVLLGIAAIEAGFLLKNTKQLKETTAKYEELNEKYSALLEEQEQSVEGEVSEAQE